MHHQLCENGILNGLARYDVLDSCTDKDEFDEIWYRKDILLSSEPFYTDTAVSII